ncbi:hypothetical protein M0Q97_08950 [Candidatus Dojkabacteria bacterium]|jgi:hypothetical protein|nr:hypothetical protein [Candidatus Dojkabacteria bacterium]
MNQEKLISEIIENIPTTIKHTSMINNPGEYNSQKYSKENCIKFNKVYLENFVDIDTYIDGTRMRIQGYLTINPLELYKYSITELDYILELIQNKSAYTQLTKDDANNLRLEIYSA